MVFDLNFEGEEDYTSQQIDHSWVRGRSSLYFLQIKLCQYEVFRCLEKRSNCILSNKDKKRMKKFLWWQHGMTFENYVSEHTSRDAITGPLYSQSGDPVCACRFAGECDEWIGAGLRDGMVSKFRQGRPDLALHAPVCVISFSSDYFCFSAVLGFFLKTNKETFEETGCIWKKGHF